VVYSLNQTLETLFRMGSSRGYIPTFKYADVFLFMAASAVLSYFFNRKPEYEKNHLHLFQLIRFLTGSKQTNTPSTNQPEEREVKLKESISVGVIGLIRGFVIGFGIKGLISMMSKVSSKSIYRNPQKLIKESFGRSSIKFGLFVGFFVANWNGLASFLKVIRKKDDSLNSVIAGFVAGSSIAFARSNEVTMYFVAKAGEAIFHLLNDKGYVPKVKYADLSLFALAVGIIFYCSCLEPYNLRPSYFQFLRRMSKGRYDQFEELARGFHPDLFEKSGFSYKPKAHHGT